MIGRDQQRAAAREHGLRERADQPLEHHGRHQHGGAAPAGERADPHRVGAHRHRKEVAGEGREIVRAYRRPETETRVPAPHEEPPLPRHEEAVGGRQGHDGQQEERIRGGETRAEAAPVHEEDEEKEESEADRDAKTKAAAAALRTSALRLPQ